MKRTLAFITLIILILSLCSCDTASTKHPKQIELVEYIGEELSTVETELSTKLKDMTQYFDSTYRFEAETTLVDFSVDGSGKITQIHLRDSGELGYMLCGLTTEMDDVSAKNKLSENGSVFVRGEIWQCANKTDCITREDSGWIYMANSEILEEQLLLAKMENALTFQYEDSEGIYYIGNHQFVEYYYSSFPRFVHEYKSLTEYQQSVLNETIAGRYLMVSGTVTGVTDRGTIIVMCEDQSYGEEVGNILPAVGFAELTLIPEQETLLMSLSENSSIVAFGQIAPESYNGVDFDLSETIVFAVDTSAVTVPVIERPIPGITCFDSQGNLVIHENPPTETELTNQEAISALSKVLTSSELFCFVDDGQPTYTENVNSIRQICDTEFPGPLTPVRFTVVDLDQDGVTEVIVELTNNVDGWDLVLHYYNGTVYGYGFGYRAMQSIYANGVVFGSSGAYLSDAYTLQFSGYALTENPVDAGTAGEPVQWYEFTQSNISMALTSNDK